MPQLTFFPGSVRERRPGQSRNPDWHELADVMASAVTNDRSKGAAGYWVAAKVNQARGRSDAACDPTDLVALDWDDPGPASPDVLSAALGSVWYVAHTTDSHTDATPRWRVWVRLDRAYDAAELRRVVLPDAWAGAHLRAISQPAYVPTTGDDTWWLENPGGAPWAPRLSVPEAVAAPQPALAPAGPRTNPSPASINALVTRWLSNPEGTNRLAGATGACLAEWRWDDSSIEGFLAAWLHADPKLAKHTDDALRAAATRRAGGRIVGFPTMAELGVKPWEPDHPLGLTAAELLASAEDRPARPGTPPFYFYTAADIANTVLPPVNWLCEALSFAPGAPALCTGYSGTGKTTTLQDLALSIATPGRKFLGYFDVRHGAVAHIDLEQGHHQTIHTYQSLGITAEAQLVCSVLPSWKLTDPEAVKALLSAAEGRALIIIDSFRVACLGLDENDSNFAEPLNMLGLISDRTGCAFMLNHHSGKNNADRMKSARGTSAITAAVSVHWSFERENLNPDTRPCLQLVKSRNHRTPAMVWETYVEKKDGPNGSFRLHARANPGESAAEPLADRIVGMLMQGWSGSRTDLVRDLKKNRSEVYRTLDQLAQDGIIDSRGPLRLIESKP